MKPVRSRSWRYGQLEVSAATDASPATAVIAPRPTSKTTSYALPESQSTASCCVAGMVYPSGPAIAWLNPSRPAGASSGMTSRHSSGRNPATRLTPPIVVRGSRRDATAVTSRRAFSRLFASNSRYAWDDVPSAKMPPCGLFMRVASSAVRRTVGARSRSRRRLSLRGTARASSLVRCRRLGLAAEVLVLEHELARDEGRALRVGDDGHPYPWRIERRDDDRADELGCCLGAGVRVLDGERHAPVRRDVGRVIGDRVDAADDVLESDRAAHLGDTLPDS